MKPFTHHIRNILAAFLLIAGGLFTGTANAQTHLLLTYDYSVSLAGTRDYIGESSFRGGSFELGYHLTDPVSIGLKVGLHTFYEDLEKDTYQDGNLTVYGKQFRYLNSFPVLGTVQYSPAGRESRVQPYARLGIGGYYFQQRTDLGLYTFLNEYQWNFGLQPELGILISLSGRFSVNAGARYHYIFGNRSVDEQQYLTISAGIMFKDLGRR